MLVYITGSSWSGKTSVQLELLRRGYTAYGDEPTSQLDGFDFATMRDLNGLACFRNRVTGETNTQPSTNSSEWDWIIPESKIQQLRQTHQSEKAFVCSVTTNDNELVSEFDRTFGLVVDAETVLKRMSANPDRPNRYGLDDEESRKNIIDHLDSFKKKYQAFKIPFIDTSNLEVNAVVDKILSHLEPPAWI